MKQRRQLILLAVMLVLLALRWWSPPANDGAGDVAQAVVRARAISSAVGQSAASAQARAAPVAALLPQYGDLSAGTRSIEDGEPRNAFALRTPPPPAAPEPPERVAAVAPTVSLPPSPPVEVAPPPPQLQIIGTWRDDRGASVFIAGPRGVLQARTGDVLLAEYGVTQISAQQVMLKHLPSNRDVTLIVPAVPGPSFKQVP